MSQRSPANSLWYSLLWLLCWVISQVWFRFRYTGREHVPATGPVLLVSNHQSHLDPVLVGIACPRQMRALARHSLFVWPLGWLIRSLGAVPVDRERSALGGIKATIQLLREGEVVLVFPEGTRTPHGRLQPLQSGFCMLARRSGAAIVPVVVRGAFDALPRGSSLPRPRPIRLAFCEPVTPQQAADMSDDQLIDLVSRRMHEAISEATSQPV